MILRLLWYAFIILVFYFGVQELCHAVDISVYDSPSEKGKCVLVVEHDDGYVDKLIEDCDLLLDRSTEEWYIKRIEDYFRRNYE